MNILRFFKKKKVTEINFSQREVENIIKEVWFRGTKHLLEENNDGKHSLYNIYKDYGFVKTKS